MEIIINLVNLIETNRKHKGPVSISKSILNNWSINNNVEDDMEYNLEMLIFLLQRKYLVFESKDMVFFTKTNPIYSFKKVVEFERDEKPLLVTLCIEIESFTPGRPAPPCSNPDSPSFSDPGDNEEIEYNLYCIGKNEKTFPLPEFLEFLYEDDDLYDYISKKCDSIFQEQDHDCMVDNYGADHPLL